MLTGTPEWLQHRKWKCQPKLILFRIPSHRQSPWKAQSKSSHLHIYQIPKYLCRWSQLLLLKKSEQNAAVICLFWTEKLKRRRCTSGMLNVFFLIIRKSKWTPKSSRVMWKEFWSERQLTQINIYIFLINLGLFLDQCSNHWTVQECLIQLEAQFCQFTFKVVFSY